jgi:hypothetical protein
MKIETVTFERSGQLELSEANAWIDMYEAAPKDYAKDYQLEVKRIGQLTVLLSGSIPFPHFNCVMGLGLMEPASEQVVDDLLEIFARRNIKNFYIHLTPHSQPLELAQWLLSRNLRVKSGWDRIYRADLPFVPVKSQLDNDFIVDRITRETAFEWAEYISKMYGLPTTPWLMSLVGRRGWYQYVLRKNSIIHAARSMYIHTDGTAWLGIDAPVPGIMAPSFDLDFQLCQAIVEDGTQFGARQFLADIEAPSTNLDTPAYHYFDLLNFNKLYLRRNYGF